jgi:hypothetical protein
MGVLSSRRRVMKSGKLTVKILPGRSGTPSPRIRSRGGRPLERMGVLSSRRPVMKGGGGHDAFTLTCKVLSAKSLEHHPQAGIKDMKSGRASGRANGRPIEPKASHERWRRGRRFQANGENPSKPQRRTSLIRSIFFYAM